MGVPGGSGVERVSPRVASWNGLGHRHGVGYDWVFDGGEAGLGVGIEGRRTRVGIHLVTQLGGGRSLRREFWRHFRDVRKNFLKKRKGKERDNSEGGCLLYCDMAADSDLARKALRLLCEAGRQDLLRPGVLGQAWVGLEPSAERPRRAASVGVSEAVKACLPKKGKRRAKSEVRLEGGLVAPGERADGLTNAQSKRGRSEAVGSASANAVSRREESSLSALEHDVIMTVGSDGEEPEVGGGTHKTAKRKVKATGSSFMVASQEQVMAGRSVGKVIISAEKDLNADLCKTNTNAHRQDVVSNEVQDNALTKKCKEDLFYYKAVPVATRQSDEEVVLGKPFHSKSKLVKRNLETAQLGFMPKVASEAGEWVWFPADSKRQFTKASAAYGLQYFGTPSGLGGQEVLFPKVPAHKAGISMRMPAERITAPGRWPEEMMGSVATLSSTRDKDVLPLPVSKKDWDKYDGGVGDGERPGVSGLGRVGDSDVLSLVYEEDLVDMEEGDLRDSEVQCGTVGKKVVLEGGVSTLTAGARGFGAIHRSRADARKMGGTDGWPAKEAFGGRDFRSTGLESTKGMKPWWSVWDGRTGKEGGTRFKSVGIGNEVIGEKTKAQTVDIAVGGEVVMAEQREESGKYAVTAAASIRNDTVSSDASNKEGEVSEKVHLKRLPYMGIAMPLGSHLSDKTKRKIWNHEYVDVFKLLHRDLLSKEGSKEEEWELARRPRVPKTIENWTSAFLIYASIYCEQHADRAVAIFKYMDIIRKAQMHFSGYAWLDYDEEFRARMSLNSQKPWGDIDSELWLQWMSTNNLPATAHTASGLPVTYRPFQQRPAFQGAGSLGRGQGISTGACWGYNKGLCSRQFCRFKHECSKCGGRHTLTQCFSNNGPGEQWRPQRGRGQQFQSAFKGTHSY